jgi:hypothetical protein
MEKKERNGGAHIWRGELRASRNGGWEGEFGVCKMKACLEALLEMDFYTKPPNFGVEAHMEAPAGDALTNETPTSPLPASASLVDQLPITPS